MSYPAALDLKTCSYPDQGGAYGQKIVPGAASIRLAALILSGCVSQSAYNEQTAQLQQVQAQAAVQQAEIAKMRVRAH
jgi:outer membrane murein-binding lipoprotein Lpp